MKKYFLLLLIVAAGCQSKKTPADLIIKGGTIYTMDEKQPVVEAVAVNGDTIAFAGNLAEAAKYQDDHTHVIDLNGATMTPGFIESHGHIMNLGQALLNLDLTTIRNYDEMVEKVKEAVAKAQPGEWIIGRGWHQEKWDARPEPVVKGFQTHKKLSKISPDNPVFLVHASGHAAFANEKAMRMAGVNQLSVEKRGSAISEGGEIIRDPLGNPTGIFNEQAMTLITGVIPESTRETETRALELAIAECLENGITSFQDASLSNKMAQSQQDYFNLYHEFRDNGKLKVRLYVTLSGWNMPMIKEWYKRGPEIDTTKHLLTIRAIKLNCDGALGSRGAWLLEPYSDQPTTMGMATYSMDTVLQVSRDALKYGFQVWSHAIGDRANREILDRYEQAFKENPDKTDHRFRIEHAQHLHPNDIPRFGQLGVIPAMQAIHLSSDRPWAIERLGEKRIKEGAYVWQSLLKSGASVINGSDVPVEPISPVASFYASVTRMTLAGAPAGGYEPEEKMTREQALRSYTLDAAYGAFEENIKGSITRGKLADFTVFTQDIMKVPDSDLLKTEIRMTIVGGKKVFEKK